MAEIKPFRGYRFAVDKPEGIGPLCAPPYDMIDDAMVESLYGKHPHNVVRITQNRREASDAANRDRHARAAKFFSDWVESGVIARDGEDSLYIYRQKFCTLGNDGKIQDHERIGVCALVKLADFDERVILPHEYTLSGPKQDRYELMEATRANTGQIFGIASDDNGRLYAHIRAVMEASLPAGEFTDENGVVHSLYRCADAGLISHTAELMKPRNILIADGHHRYETALRFYRDQRDEAFSRVMMTIVSMADPGLVIRPFHRLVRKTDQGRQIDSMASELAKYFDLAPLGKASAEGVGAALSEKKPLEIVFWDCASKNIYGLRLNAGGADLLSGAMPGQSDKWKRLDVSKINCIIINGILSLPLDGHVLHDIVHYANDVVTGARKLSESGSGYYYGGFFINPMSINVINDTVKGGERMPQKSTNFFPKLYSGLVFNRMG
ncbi:MAG: DUF1015 domain-containing protein [Chitinispirillales bacterium]|jgi:uncharacterized protein (DUF1015 family)|nr:DUF1015 domain-containing protein [Chitinispirillales bacterium]